MSNEKTARFGTKQIAMTAALLAVCILSQVFKNLSIFITGPIVNACLILAVLMVNLPCAIILGIITPITAYIITGGGVMAAVPIIVPFIMMGNIVIVVMTFFLIKKEMREPKDMIIRIHKYVVAVVSSLAKGVFMGITISLWLLPTFIPEQSPLRGKMGVLQTTFSLYQFITACIGFIYAFLVWSAMKHVNMD
ncbi:MAG: ECF transporter S component [Lachnospiraceae bacterium]|nr:ECF transporter S component [Lachnospiraceae bacterium]